MPQRRTGAGNGTSIKIDAMEYDFDFIETAATWNNPAGDGSDTTPGGTFGTLLSSETFDPSVENNLVTFGSSTAFIDAVVAALDTDNTINLLLARDGSGGSVFARFQSNLNGVQPSPAELVIDFDILAVPEPASLAVWALLGLIGAGYALRRRVGQRAKVG